MSLGPRVYRYVPVVVVLKLKSQLFTWILKSKLKVCTSEIVDKLSAVQKNAVSGRIRHVCVLFIDFNTEGCCKSHVTLVSTQALPVRSSAWVQCGREVSVAAHRFDGALF